MPVIRRNSTFLGSNRSRQASKLLYARRYSHNDVTTTRLTTSSLCIPVEIIDRIVEIYLAQTSNPSNSQRFSSIASLTLTSSTFRHIALRWFFQSLNIMTREEWFKMFRMLASLSEAAYKRGEMGGFAWVKTFYAPSKVISKEPARLTFFSHLRALWIDLAHEGLSTQHPTIVNLFLHLEPVNTCANLTTLTLSSLPRIDCLLLGLIAKTFPRLVDLYLSCTERIDFGCCWACFEDSLSCTLHSPIPNDYFEGMEMANAFGTALKPLEHLEHLHLGIFLSHELRLSLHVSHMMDEADSPGLVPNWGKCEQCFDDVSMADIKRRELEASIFISRKLKTLKSIGWSSFFAYQEETIRVEQHINSDDTVEDVAEESTEEVQAANDGFGRVGETIEAQPVNSKDEQDMKTTIWILRTGGGRIRVRRAPW